MTTTAACVICCDDSSNELPFVSLPCGHIFHHHCIKKWIIKVGTSQIDCPTCRQLFHETGIRRIFLPSSIYNDKNLSSKSNGLVSCSSSSTKAKTTTIDIENQTKFFVKFVNSSVTVQDLRQLFEVNINRESIVDVSICKNKQNQSKGFGFVILQNLPNVNLVVETLNGQLWRGHRLQVAVAKSSTSNQQQDENDKNCKIFISNLNPNVDEPDLWAFFRTFGEFDRVPKLVDQKDENKPKSALITYTQPQAAQRAIDEANGKIMWKREISVSKGRGRKQNPCKVTSTDHHHHHGGAAAANQRRKKQKSTNGFHPVLQPPRPFVDPLPLSQSTKLILNSSPVTIATPTKACDKSVLPVSNKISSSQTRSVEIGPQGDKSVKSSSSTAIQSASQNKNNSTNSPFHQETIAFKKSSVALSSNSSASHQKTINQPPTTIKQTTTRNSPSPLLPSSSLSPSVAVLPKSILSSSSNTTTPLASASSASVYKQSGGTEMNSTTLVRQPPAEIGTHQNYSSQQTRAQQVTSCTTRQSQPRNSLQPNNEYLDYYRNYASNSHWDSSTAAQVGTQFRSKNKKSSSSKSGGSGGGCVIC